MKRNLLILSLVVFIVGCNSTVDDVNQQNQPGDPTKVNISTSSLGVAEGDKGDTTTVTASIALSGKLTNDVDIDFTVTNGTSANDDYAVLTTSPITIVAGQTSRDISIQILGDLVVEARENIIVSIKSVSTSDVAIGSNSSVDIIIVDDDGLRLNDTGVSLCSNTVAELSCSNAAISTYPGQDAVYGLDVSSKSPSEEDKDGHAGFNFTKLAADGVPLSDQSLPYATTPWSCVKDNNTGRVWEVKTPTGIQGKITMTWFNSTGVNDGGDQGVAAMSACGVTNCDTEKYVAYVNAINGSGLCGFNDWRLPTYKELNSIVDFSAPSGVTDKNYFPNTVVGLSSIYWTSSQTSSPTATIADYVSTIRFDVGISLDNRKSTPRYVRVVRDDVPQYDQPITDQSNCNANLFANGPDTNYVINATNATAVDIVTSLMWERCAVGATIMQSCQDIGVADKFTWQEALKYIEDINAGAGVAGHKDWRMPNVKELESILERGCSAPKVNENIFPRTVNDWYWSSTFSAQDPTQAWVVNLYGGIVNKVIMTNKRNLRIVRDAD